MRHPDDLEGQQIVTYDAHINLLGEIVHEVREKGTGKASDVVSAYIWTDTKERLIKVHIKTFALDFPRVHQYCTKRVQEYHIPQFDVDLASKPSA